MKPVQPPTATDVATIAEALHLGLTAAEVEAITAHVGGMVSGLDLDDERGRLADSIMPAVGPRASRRPSPDENPLGGWYVRSEIRTRDEGPLAGRTIAVKDSVAVGGIPMANGSSVLEGYVPDFDATVITRVLEAGGTIAGKAVCEPMCMSAFGHAAHTGFVRNPYDPSRGTGGSSSGSGCLVGARAVDLAIGGDNGGSIRIPASWCGIYGLKPTWGLVPYTGAFAMNPQIDHLGPMTTSMADLELFLGVLAGPDPLDPRQAAGLTLGEPCFDDVRSLRVGVLREGFGWPDVSEPEVDGAVEDAARSLARLGAEVRDVSNPMHRRGVGGAGLAEIGRHIFDDDAIGGPFLGYTSVTMTDYFHDAWRSRADQLPLTGKLTLVASHYLFGQPIQPQLARAHNLTLVQRRSYDDLLRDVDVLVMPTTPCRALPLPTHELTPVEELTLAFSAQSRNTGAFNSGGHPALSVPCAVVDGLPVGMMLVGRRGDDATVVRAGRLFADEVYTPDPPPVH